MDMRDELLRLSSEFKLAADAVAALGRSLAERRLPDTSHVLKHLKAVETALGALTAHLGLDAGQITFAELEAAVAAHEASDDSSTALRAIQSRSNDSAVLADISAIAARVEEHQLDAELADAVASFWILIQKGDTLSPEAYDSVEAAVDRDFGKRVRRAAARGDLYSDDAAQGAEEDPMAPTRGDDDTTATTMPGDRGFTQPADRHGVRRGAPNLQDLQARSRALEFPDLKRTIDEAVARLDRPYPTERPELRLRLDRVTLDRIAQRTATPAPTVLSDQPSAASAAASTPDGAIHVGKEDVTGENADAALLDSSELALVAEEVVAHAEPADVDAADSDLSSAATSNLVNSLIGANITTLRSLAYQLANAAERAEPACELVVPPWAIRTLILGTEIAASDEQVAFNLRREFEHLQNEALVAAGGISFDLRLLLTAACLKATIVAPLTGASGVLRSLNIHGDVGKLVERIVYYGDRLSGVERGALRAARSKDAWHAEYASLKLDAQDWANQSDRKKFRYAAATYVSRAWNKPGGFAEVILHPLLHDNFSDIESVSERLRTTDIAAIDRAIDEADKTSVTKRIIGPARQSLREQARTALDFARKWLQLARLRPEAGGYLQRNIDGLITEYRRLLPAALSELETLTRDDHSVASCGARALTQALTGITALFDADRQASDELGQTADQILSMDLLRAGVSLDEDWNPVATWKATFQRLVRALETPLPDWQRVFKTCLAEGDYMNAERISIYAHRMSLEHANSMASCLERALEGARVALQEESALLSNEVEKALTNGLISEAEREKHITLIAAHSEAADATTLVRYRNSLALVTESLHEVKVLRRAELEQELSAIEISAPDRLKIDRLLDDELYRNATEYLNLVRSGSPLPEPVPQQESAFHRFFPRTASELAVAFEANGNNHHELIRAVETHKAFGPVGFELLTHDETTSVKKCLNIWFSAKRSRSIDDGSVTTLMNALGYSSTSVSTLTFPEKGARAVFEARCEPISDRSIIPLSTFGSQATGAYRVIAVWGITSEQQIMDAVDDSTRVATIVLAFGQVSNVQRRTLGAKCRQGKRSFVLIDDYLFTFLMSERDSRLSTLFHCAIPFTYAQPFTATAGLVPPEMFYGRTREIQDIRDPFGPCVIYGGRQLGKTALLRHVQERYHSIDQGSLVIWIDLKAENIGTSDDPLLLAKRMAKELKDLKVLKGDVAQLFQAKVVPAIDEWLKATPGRQILFLLDEADEFLTRDANDEFKTVDRLKNIMDRTGRLFKVVFAGLHNVIRTTTQSNHPLAHFGAPINIGPLIANNEWQDAIALIKEPLDLLGFAIDQDIAFTILSQTNYYPSLLQLYGRLLIEQLYGSPYINPRTFPPYNVQRRDVDDAYHKTPHLRQQISDRFDLTLRLDNRYLIIAYALLFSARAGDIALDEGADVDLIHVLAIDAWPEGFKNITRNEFIVLLEEMVGLGVLRKVLGGTFTFRSPNVTLLMGSQDDILRVLSEPRVAPQPYDAASFRQADAHGARSPLTALQLNEIHAPRNGVTVIVGSDALDIGKVESFVARDQDLFRSVAACLDHRQYDDILRVRDLPQGTTILYAGAETPWNSAWVDAAADRSERSKAEQRYMHCVFIADARMAWGLLRDGELGRFENRGVNVISLERWHSVVLRQWLDDCALRLDYKEQEKLEDLTGKLPWLVHRFREFAHSSPRQGLDALCEELRSRSHEEAYLAAIGIDEELLIPRQVIRAAALINEPVTVHELFELLERQLDEDSIELGLRWAERLALMQRREGGAWSPLSDVAAMLS